MARAYLFSQNIMKLAVIWVFLFVWISISIFIFLLHFSQSGETNAKVNKAHKTNSKASHEIIIIKELNWILRWMSFLLLIIRAYFRDAFFSVEMSPNRLQIGWSSANAEQKLKWKLNEFIKTSDNFHENKTKCSWSISGLINSTWYGKGLIFSLVLFCLNALSCVQIRLKFQNCLKFTISQELRVTLVYFEILFLGIWYRNAH